MFVMLPGSGGTGVSQASGSGVVYTFAGNCDFVGQVDSNTNGASNVASTIRTYEGDRDLIDIIENKWGGTTVSKYDYVNDANARRTKVANTGTAFSTNRFSLWGYNDRSELTSAKRYDCNTSGSCLTDSNTNSPVSGQQFTYTFDNIGNRTQDTGDPDANTTGYTAKNLNQYTATTSPTESFTYDNDGNLTQDALWDYAWDAENRLITVTARNPTSGSKKLGFDYDHMNRRVRKRVYTWNTFGLGFWNTTPSVDRKLVYDGWNLIEELNGLSSDAIITRFTWGLDLSGQSGSASVTGTHGAGGIGGLLACNDNSGSKNYIYFYNANGDVGQLMDVAGGTSAPAVKYEYYPYGGELLASGLAALVSPFRFSTKYWDAETQNLYYGERYLRPKMGRWANRDPLYDISHALHAAVAYTNATYSVFPALDIIDSTDTGHGHVYSMVVNSPIVFVDPKGLKLRIQANGPFSIPSQNCGQLRQDYRWTLAGSDKIPCDALIIQEVRINLECYPCKVKHKCQFGCKGRGTEEPPPLTSIVDADLSYWEVIGPINKGHKGGNSTIRQDNVSFDGLSESIGHYNQVGTARVYCREVTGDLGQAGWKPGAVGRSKRCSLATGDLGSNSSLHTTTEPEWWKNAQHLQALGSTTRSVYSTWDCCCGKLHSDGGGSPIGARAR